MNTTLTTNSPRKVQWRLPEPPKRRLRDEFADWMRTKNYARATIAAYVANVREFVLVSGKRDPRGGREGDRRGESGKVGGGE